MDNFSLDGNQELQKYLLKMSNPNPIFDKDMKSAAIQCDRGLKINTPKDTGQVAQAWYIKKQGLSDYEVINDKTTEDGKYSIIDILEDGRKEVRPKKAKSLYIPLTRKGQGKKLGAPIPKNLKYGIDYIFAMKSKKVDGKYFVRDVMKRVSSELVKRMLKTIDRESR